MSAGPAPPPAVTEESSYAPDKVAKKLRKLRKKNKANLPGYHAAVVTGLEFLKAIKREPKEMAHRRIAKNSTTNRAMSYLENMKKGDKVMLLAGFQPRDTSWLLFQTDRVDERISTFTQELDYARLAIDEKAEKAPRLVTRNDIKIKANWGQEFVANGEENCLLSDGEDRAVGMLLGEWCGDALGACVEGWEQGPIEKFFHRLEYFQDLPHAEGAPGGLGVFTGDTELMLGTAQSMVEKGSLDPKHLSNKLVEVNANGVWRSFPEVMKTILGLLGKGDDYRKVGSYFKASGSSTTSTASPEGLTRVPVVAIAFRNAKEDVLMEAVKAATLFTTVDPVGQGANYAQTLLLTMLLASNPEEFDPMPVLRDIMVTLECDSKFNDAFSRLKVFESKATEIRLAAPKSEDRRPSGPTMGVGTRTYKLQEDLVNQLCGDKEMPDASEVWSRALCIFLEKWKVPREAVVDAVQMGGPENNTLAAVVGSMCGALHGTGWVPLEWYKNLEKGGKRQVFAQAVRLYRMDWKAVNNVTNRSEPLPYDKRKYSTLAQMN